MPDFIPSLFFKRNIAPIATLSGTAVKQRSACSELNRAIEKRCAYKKKKKKKKLKVKDLANIYLKKRGASDSYPGRWGDDTWPSSGAWWCGSAMASLHSPICLLPPLDRTACSQRPACDWVRDAMSRSVCSAWLWLSAHSGQRSLKNVKKQKWHDRNVHMMILTLTPAVL